jgi:hypothetical protein
MQELREGTSVCRRRRTTMVFALLVLIAFAASRLAAEPFLPLAVGNNWEYDGLVGEHELWRVQSTSTIWGSETYRILFEESTQNEGLRNYWTSDEDGSALLWGFYRWQEDSGKLYAPPLRMVDAPLHVGKTWRCTTHVYDLPDTVYSETMVQTFVVYSEGPISVPAGDFYAYGVGTTVPPPGFSEPGKTVGLDGRVTQVGSLGLATDWWTEGVGEVQYKANDTYRLTSYELITAVDPTSWGRIKAVFR